MPPKTATASISIQPNALAGKKCIITGEIPGQSRKSAEQILINAGATIEKSLNKKVQLVVLGEDAGPKKLEKIEELGVETKEWDELMDEIKGDGGADADTEEDTKEDEETEEEEVEEVRQGSVAYYSAVLASLLLLLSYIDCLANISLEAQTEEEEEQAHRQGKLQSEGRPSTQAKQECVWFYFPQGQEGHHFRHNSWP